ncbi:MAG: choice-of-anchor A family protein, partial [Hydrogenoanaerobacterium sp.]
MGAPFYFFGDNDVFVLGNHKQTGGSAEGSVFVGGTATYNNYTIGTALPIVYPPNPNPRPISLFVLGVMDITGGTNTQNSALSA